MSFARGRATAAALVVGVGLAACAGGRATPPGPAEPASTAAGAVELACSVDEDCVVSTFESCCACPQCPGDPHPLSREGARLELMRARCDTEDCRDEDAMCAVAGMCPPPPPVRAVCDAGRCALRPSRD